MSAYILEGSALYKGFHQGDRHIEVLRGVSLRVSAGETVAILGKSGSGKSTLLSVLAGLEKPDRGEVHLAGQRLGDLAESSLIRKRAAVMSIIFQQFHLLESLTALENIELALEILDHAKEMGQKALEDVGLTERASHFPKQLSGGEQQRVAIARAFAVRPKILFADEPSGNLDTETGEQVMNLLFTGVKQRHMALILVTHNEELAQRCDRRYQLTAGNLT